MVGDQAKVLVRAHNWIEEVCEQIIVELHKILADSVHVVAAQILIKSKEEIIVYLVLYRISFEIILIKVLSQ